MVSQKSRDPRRSISLKARMRCEGDWQDVSVANVSRRGLMLRTPSPPAKGSFIELRHRSVCIIGRVVWSKGATCGVRTQDVVDVDALLSSAPPTAKGAQRERRAAPRRADAPPPAHVLAQRAERSRNLAQIFQWSAIALGGILAAVTVGKLATATLETSLTRVESAMQQARL